MRSVRPRIYPNLKTPPAPYSNCGMCEEIFNGESDAVSYMVPHIGGSLIMRIDHVACVPEIDLSDASVVVDTSVERLI